MFAHEPLDFEDGLDIKLIGDLDDGLQLGDIGRVVCVALAEEVDVFPNFVDYLLVLHLVEESELMPMSTRFPLFSTPAHTCSPDLSAAG